MLGDHLHPGGGVDLHQGVRNEDDVHPVEDTGEDAVPEPDVPLEVEDADHDLALGVVAGECESAGVGEHGCPGDADPQHTAVLLGGVLHVGRSVVCQTWRRVPVLGGSGEVLSDEPVEFGPAFELNYFSSRVLWQTFEAGLRGESESDVTGTWRRRNIYIKF